MSKCAFTLIELVIVLTILAILAAVAIPAFQELQKAARNSATEGALGGLRDAIKIYRANEIENGRTTGVGSGTAAGWPTSGQITDRHCAGYNSGLPHVMENENTPPNPWASVSSYVPTANADCVTNVAVQKGTVSTTSNVGWRVDVNNSSIIWANTAENDGTPSVNLENNCAADPTTENCF